MNGIRKIVPWKITPPPPKKKIVPLWKHPLWIFPQWKLPLRIFPPRKLAPGETTSSEIPSPFINHASERKNKIIEFFTFKKAVQYNILFKITKVLFDTQVISQKILGLDTFFTESKKIPKVERKRKSSSGIYLPVVQFKEN